MYLYQLLVLIKTVGIHRQSPYGLVILRNCEDFSEKKSWIERPNWLRKYYFLRLIGQVSNQQMLCTQLYSTIVGEVRKSPCVQDAGRSVERIIIHAGILQNSCETHATFPAACQHRQISRTNFSCVMRGNIFHGRTIFRYSTCRCV